MLVLALDAGSMHAATNPGEPMFNDDGQAGRKGDGPRAEPRSTNVFQTANARPAAQPQASSQSDASKAADDGGRHAAGRLVVGPNIKMRGVEVTDCDVVIVEGQLEAKFDSRVVEIAETGVLSGSASMDVAEIWGRFEGELTVRQQLIVHPTGQVNGQVRYSKIRIEEGGEISGEISTLKGHAVASGPIDMPMKSVASGSK
jgi:cytoskeletal protein CcmA (bactofilin family)